MCMAPTSDKPLKNISAWQSASRNRNDKVFVVFNLHGAFKNE